VSLTFTDVAAWLAGVDTKIALDDPEKNVPGERVLVSIASQGGRSGGEQWGREPNINVTVVGKDLPRVDMLADQVEAVMLGNGPWPTTTDGERVLVVDFNPSYNGWQRQPRDPSDRHRITTQFTAQMTVQPTSP
jgi:hypothetical protein